MIIVAMLLSLIGSTIALAEDYWTSIKNAYMIPCVTLVDITATDVTGANVGTIPKGTIFLAQGSKYETEIGLQYETEIRYILVMFNGRAVFIDASLIKPLDSTPVTLLNGYTILSGPLPKDGPVARDIERYGTVQPKVNAQAFQWSMQMSPP